MKFELTKKQIKAFLLIAAKKDARSCLNGLHILQDERGTILEATDGHSAVRLIVSRERQEPNKLVLPREQADAVIQSKTLPDHAIIEFEVVQESEFVRKIHVKAMGMSYCFDGASGSFPSLDGLVAAKEFKTELAWIDPEKVSVMSKVVATLFDVSKILLPRSFVVIPNGENVALATYSDSEDFYGLIMPMRIEMPAAKRPPF